MDYDLIAESGGGRKISEPHRCGSLMISGELAGRLWATRVPEARSLAASVARRVYAGGLCVRFPRLGYVICLRYSCGRDW